MTLDNADQDGAGDVCDDNDGVLDGADNCPLAANVGQADTDGDGTGDACNDADDADGDEWAYAFDNCPDVANGNQADLDGNGLGDACDPDIDGDEVVNAQDECANTLAGEIVDWRGCSIEQLCPCAGPRGTTTLWKNHGKHVSCTAHAVNAFVEAGLITDAEGEVIVSDAAKSACGHKSQ